MPPFESNWPFFVQMATRRWSKLSAEQLLGEPGNFERLATCVQGAYGVSNADATCQVQEWRATFGSGIGTGIRTASLTRRRAVVAGSALAALRYTGPSKAHR